MKCENCKRQLPNKNWITKNGCKWCNIIYHKTKTVKKLGKEIISIVFKYQGYKNWETIVFEKIKKLYKNI